MIFMFDDIWLLNLILMKKNDFHGWRFDGEEEHDEEMGRKMTSLYLWFFSLRLSKLFFLNIT